MVETGARETRLCRGRTNEPRTNEKERKLGETRSRALCVEHTVVRSKGVGAAAATSSSVGATISRRHTTHLQRSKPEAVHRTCVRSVGEAVRSGTAHERRRATSHVAVARRGTALLATTTTSAAALKAIARRERGRGE